MTDFEFSVELPLRNDLVYTNPMRVSGSVFDWLNKNVGKGAATERSLKARRIVGCPIFWYCRESKVKTLELFFLNKEDAVHFKMVWI
jgi:hypothetical protein